MEINEPSTGIWTVNYRSDSQHLLKITGVSLIKLKYGFSTHEVSRLTETTNRPFQGSISLIYLNTILNFQC